MENTRTASLSSMGQFPNFQQQQAYINNIIQQNNRLRLLVQSTELRHGQQIEDLNEICRNRQEQYRANQVQLIRKHEVLKAQLKYYTERLHNEQTKFRQMQGKNSHCQTLLSQKLQNLVTSKQQIKIAKGQNRQLKDEIQKQKKQKSLLISQNQKEKQRQTQKDRRISQLNNKIKEKLNPQRNLQAQRRSTQQNNQIEELQNLRFIKQKMFLEVRKHADNQIRLKEIITNLETQVKTITNRNEELTKQINQDKNLVARYQNSLNCLQGLIKHQTFNYLSLLQTNEEQIKILRKYSDEIEQVENVFQIQKCLDIWHQIKELMNKKRDLHDKEIYEQKQYSKKVTDQIKELITQNDKLKQRAKKFEQAFQKMQQANQILNQMRCN